MKTPFYQEFQKIKHTLLNKIQDYYGDNLLGVALFGSAARGDLTTSSDIDLVIVLRNNRYPMRKRVQEFWENIGEDITLIGYSFILSPLIYTLEEFQHICPFFLGFLEGLEILFEKDYSFSKLMQKLQEYLKSGKIKPRKLSGRLYWQYEF